MNGKSGEPAGSTLFDALAASLVPKLDALEEIRALLGSDASISVPGVVVAGNQSAGKSSVIESLCGIKLPRGRTCVCGEVEHVCSFCSTCLAAG